MIIKIDYDMTIDKAGYPEVGDPVPLALETIRGFKNKGYTLILDTCRNGENLKKAIEFLDSANIKFDYYNENDKNLIAKYGDTRKISADISIDDKNLFTPLEDGCVKWLAVLHEINCIELLKIEKEIDQNVEKEMSRVRPVLLVPGGAYNG